MRKNNRTRSPEATVPSQDRRGFGIQWRLLAYLSIFIVFVLLMLWILQLQMLHRFYERSKDRELYMTAAAITALLGDDEATEDMVYRCAADYSLCVRVFRVQGRTAHDIATADVSSACIIHHVTSEYLAELYQYAKQNGGVYTGKLQFRSGGMVWIEGGHTSPEDDEQQEPKVRHLHGGDISALYVSVVKGQDDFEYIVMLEAVLTPMNATVATLKTQFLWIVGALLLGALGVAYLMSRRISRPLVRMNEAAKQLAAGHYDVRFSGNGYRETRELATTLNYAADALSRTDRMQKELLANVSHDLRTPLTMIRGYGEVMRDLPGENTPENVQLIIDEAERLSELVDDMLDLSRLQAGTRELKIELFDLTEVVRALMTRYDKLIEHEGYDMTFHADEHVLVQADRTMILQAVYNLINNAVNYAGDDRRVEVTQRREGERVRISVRDFGKGIEEEHLPLIWDRYYKVDRVHTRATVGTGLGLSITKDILERHGADYGVRSTPGEGSEFWFELPVEHAQQGTAHEKENDDGEFDSL